MTTEKKAAPLALGYDPAMQVPLVGQEGYRHPDSGSDFIDERFAPLDNSGSGAGSRALKAFIEEQVAEQTPATVVHVLDEPFAVFYDKGTWRSTGKLNGMKHALTGKSREEVLDKLVRLGQRVEAERVHELTESERLQVVRLAQSGDARGAIALHLRLSIGETRASEYADPADMLADPALAGVYDECALLTWHAARPGVQDSDEFQEFLHRYRGGRPLNFDLLDAAWTAFLSHQEKQATRAAVSRFAKQEEPSPQEVQRGLEDMSDKEIKTQYCSTAKAVARAAR